MRGIQIKNSTGKEASIDVIADIGENWFDPEAGFTMRDMRNKLDEVQASTIRVNISSMGGDMDHAFTINKMLRAHPAYIIADFIGPSASSATILALGANEIQIDGNAAFLVHDPWTGVIGNARELRKAADNLDVWGERAVDAYQKKTGKQKSVIRKLMAEEKWITAEEAKEWGFVDHVNPPTMKVAASINKAIHNPQFESLVESKKLPEIPENIKTKIANMAEQETPQEPVKDENAEKLNKLQSVMADVFNIPTNEKTAEENTKLQAKVTEHESAIEALEAQVSNHATEVTQKDEALSHANEKISAAQKEVENLQTSIGEYQAKQAELEGEIERLKNEVVGEKPNNHNEDGVQKPAGKQEPKPELTGAAKDLKTLYNKISDTQKKFHKNENSEG